MKVRGPPRKATFPRIGRPQVVGRRADRGQRTQGQLLLDGLGVRGTPPPPGGGAKDTWIVDLDEEGA